MNAQHMHSDGGESKARKRKSTRNSDHWYPRNAQDFFDGTRDLTPEQRGVYNDIVDLIYIYGGALRLSDRVIAGFLVIDIRKWTHIKRVLLDKKKLFLTPEGWLHNERAVEVLTARELANNRRSTSKQPRPDLDATSGQPPPSHARDTAENPRNNNGRRAVGSTYTRARDLELEVEGEKKERGLSKVDGSCLGETPPASAADEPPDDQPPRGFRVLTGGRAAAA